MNAVKHLTIACLSKSALLTLLSVLLFWGFAHPAAAYADVLVEPRDNGPISFESVVLIIAVVYIAVLATLIIVALSRRASRNAKQPPEQDGGPTRHP